MDPCESDPCESDRSRSERTESDPPLAAKEGSSPAGSPPPGVNLQAGEGGLHDFEAQKRIHQQIRNDPDYDDWEYGTEPLPHEAWRTKERP